MSTSEQTVADLHEFTKIMREKLEETAAMMTAMDGLTEALAKTKSVAEKLLVRHYFVNLKELQ